MTREEAIQILTRERDEDIFGGYTLHRKKIHEAETMAIEALKGEQLDEWCTDCKEYDTEKKCCPRFNRVIRGAMKREPSEDLISRTEATEIFEAMLKTVTDQKIKIGISRSWQQIKDLPSADRPMVIKCEPFLSKEDFKTFAEQVRDQNVILVPHEAEVVSTNTSTNTSTKSTNISTDPSADRPRPIEPTITVDLESGVVPISACEPKAPKTIIYADRIYTDRPKGRWHYSDGKPATIGQSFGVICDQCGTKSEYCTNFCGECGADMRGEDE